MDMHEGHGDAWQTKDNRRFGVFEEEAVKGNRQG